MLGRPELVRRRDELREEVAMLRAERDRMAMNVSQALSPGDRRAWSSQLDTIKCRLMTACSELTGILNELSH